jgi:predicted negative regulator of RcsB-dependent stress response
MAEDYLTDDEQWEAAKRWFAQNGLWLLGGVVLMAALLAGWRFYESHGSERALRAAAEFDTMTAALDHNDRSGARKTAARLVATYPGTPYADQAELTLARLSIDEGQDANAIAPLTHVMQSSKDAQLKNIARLRLARVQIDEGKPDDALATLAVGENGAFAARFHEVRGDALYAKKDFGGAGAEYRAALGATDQSAPDAQVLQLKISDLGAAAAPTDVKGKS